MMLFVVYYVRIREGEELKAPRHASAAAARDDHVTTRDIVPTDIAEAAIYLRH